MAGKAKRLNKVAKEFNISIATIVEFLETKGIEIDSSPNTKIDPEIMAVLDEEFAEDKEAKEISESTTIAATEKRESISLKDLKEEEEPPKTETAAEKAKMKVEVVGKIDLDKVADKPKAKKEEKKEEVVKEEKPKEEVAEEPKQEKEEEQKPEKIETIKAKSEDLSGPKVVGKIELPVEKKKEPAEKKKRKRIKKVNVEKQAKAHTGKKGKGKRAEKPQVTEQEIQKEIKETLARLQSGGKKSGAKFRREKRQSLAEKRAEEAEQE